MKKNEPHRLVLATQEMGSNWLFCAWRRHRYLIYAFLFPFVLTYIAYFTRLIYPIGNRCILTVDLYHQYAPFLSELYEKLAGWDSFLYTWNAGLGLNFLALAAYYLISPFNLILLLFPRANLPEAITLIQVLKVGLCSLSLAWYLRRKHGRDGMGLVVFGTLYAMSSYILAYSWNVMWLDGVLMLPVVAWGLEEMIAGRRYLRYVVALAWTITFCYYIAWFVCLFLIVYFFVAFFSRHPALRPGLFFRKGFKFAFFSLLAAGLSAFVVIPTYTALQLTSAVNDVAPGTWHLSFSLFDFLTNHLLLVPLHIREGLPNIYCGLSVLLLVPLYFSCRTIPTRAKLAHLLGLLALFLSFSIGKLDFWWNGGHYPNQLPYRYAFTYVFLVLSMGYPVFLRLREISARMILGVAMAAAGFVILADQLGAEVAAPATVYLSLLFIALLAAALAYAGNPRHARELRVTVLVSILVAEILVHSFVTIDLLDRTEYYSSRDGFVADRVRLIDLMDTVEDDGSGAFYRVEVLEPRTVNDTVLHSYRGVSVFASTAYLETTQVMKALGLHNNGINSYRYADASAVLESMLGIRYLVGKDANYTRSTLETWTTQGEYTVFHNPYALPIAYMVGSEMVYWNLYKDPFSVQNQFIELATGIADVQIPLAVEVTSESGMVLTQNVESQTFSYTQNGTGDPAATLSFTVPTTREVCFYLDATQLDFNTEVLFDDKDATLRTYDLTRPYMVDLGRVEAGTVVHVRMRFKEAQSGQVKLYAAMLDVPKYKQAMARLAEQGLAVDSFTDTRISGTIHVEDAGTLFTSIPYDKGWTAKVNGYVVETTALADGLLSLSLQPGTHRVELSYRPVGLTDGLKISGASLVLLLLVAAILRLLNRRHPPEPSPSEHWPPRPEWEDSMLDAADVPSARAAAVDEQRRDPEAGIRRVVLPGIEEKDVPVHEVEDITPSPVSALPPTLPHRPALLPERPVQADASHMEPVDAAAVSEEPVSAAPAAAKEESVSADPLTEEVPDAPGTPGASPADSAD